MKFRSLLALVCLTTACNLSDDGVTTSSNNKSNNATNNASNNGSNNTNACATCSDAEVCFEEACCAPKTCGANDCGTIVDGCGSTIECGVCGCTEDNFAETCPTRPCETAVGCNENSECLYEAVQCGGSACTCAGENCTDTEVRDCRDPGALVCPADFCDPSPTMVNNKVVFQNQCTQPPGANCDFSNLCAQGACAGATCAEAPCGVCNLGFWECAPTTTDATCYDIPLSATSAAQTNCNDNTQASTFLYLDHVDGIDAAGSGSRAQPYKTYDAALAAAKQRGAKGIVIRSGLVMTSTLELENGISLYGGFSGAPNWKYDGGNLSVNVTSSDSNGNIVAVKARDITERTVLYRVNITAGDATAQKSSSYGLHAVNATGLVLQEVTIEAGNGAAGRDGVAGVRGNNGGPGGPGASAQAPGAAGVNDACPLAKGGLGGVGGSAGNFPGIIGQPSARGIAGGIGGAPQQSGQPGNESNVASVDGMSGAGGVHAFSVMGDYYTVTGDGGVGTAGLEGWGGGGGGGAGGISIPAAGNFPGAGGGGGAAGGCGGSAGQGGLAGGGSFGVFAIASTGMKIEASTIRSKNAGNGGAGGKGGAAGNPGVSGAGGPPILGSAFGGKGGNGTAGGVGGPGGGGAGGDAFAIFCDTTQVTPVDSTLTFGSMGIGGISVGADGENGSAAETYNCQ